MLAPVTERIAPELILRDPAAALQQLRHQWQPYERISLQLKRAVIAAEDDTRRVAYVQRALEGVLDCLDEGITVLGYTMDAKDIGSRRE